MSIINQNPHLQTGERVYLYNDPEYTGTLLGSIEKTHPPRWTVRLDDGRYQAVIDRYITPIIDEDTIPFSDSPEYIQEAKVKSNAFSHPKAAESKPTDSNPPSTNPLETENQRLKDENLKLRQELDKLRRQNEILSEELEQIQDVLRQAKDTSPVLRPSIQRIMRMAASACLDLIRTTKGWVLKLGNKARQFYHLADIWYFLSKKEWTLDELFVPELCISVKEIVPRKRQEKKPTPLSSPYREPMLKPWEIMQRREILLVTGSA